MAVFTITSGPKPMISRFTDSDQVENELDRDYQSSGGITETVYTRPLFNIAGFGVSHMHIDLASVALMAMLVGISLVTHFRH